MSRSRAHRRRRRRRLWAIPQTQSTLPRSNPLVLAHANCQGTSATGIGEAAVHLHARCPPLTQRGKCRHVLGFVDARSAVPADAVALCGLSHYRHHAPDIHVAALVSPELHATILHDSGCNVRSFLRLRLSAKGERDIAVCVAHTFPAGTALSNTQLRPSALTRPRCQPAQ